MSYVARIMKVGKLTAIRKFFSTRSGKLVTIATVASPVIALLPYFGVTPSTVSHVSESCKGSASSVGGLIGSASGSVKLDNVTISNSTINGCGNVGVLIGSTDEDAKVEAKGVRVTDVRVNGIDIESNGK